jgi:hypothetical protein
VCDNWRGGDIRWCFQSRSGGADGLTRALNECFIQAVDDGFMSLDREIPSGNSHFLNFERPLVAGVAKGPGWLKAAENTPALDHILSRVFRLYA